MFLSFLKEMHDLRGERTLRRVLENRVNVEELEEDSCSNRIIVEDVLAQGP